MAKTSVEIDRDIATEAAAVLGTVTLKDTINAALLEVVQARRRLELIELLADPERFDFSVLEDARAGKDRGA